MDKKQTGGAPENKEKREPIPYFVHEDAMVRAERYAKRLFISLIVAISLIFVSNAVWLYAWFSYDYVSEESITVDGQHGVASYVGGDGSIYNGEDCYKTLENASEEEP